MSEMASENFNPIDFTCDDEMEFLQVGDNATQITGVIIKIDPPSNSISRKSKEFGTNLSSRRKSVNMKRKQQKNDEEEEESDNTPLRAIFSNMANKKIRVLFWNDRKKEFNGKILNQILRISRANIVFANPAFIKQHEDLMDKEISVQSYTKVEILGPWVTDHNAEEEFQHVNLKDSGSFVGKSIRVSGYIKTTFESIVKGNSSYGSGAITDCHNRLLIHVTSFEDSLNSFPEGIHIEVKGKLRSTENSTVILQVKNLTYITKVDELVKSSAEMRKGFVPIFENENYEEKRIEDQTNEDQEIPTKKAKNSNMDIGTDNTDDLDDLINRL